MIRAMMTAASGMKAQQSQVDTIANNIANANTIGFKGNTIVFQDTLSQIMSGAGAPDAAGGNGGTNPIQVGLGVQVAATTGNFNQGAAQVTGRATDLMIQGDGFFVLGEGDDRVYTRAGAFTFDAAGTLVGPSGKPVMGWSPPAAPPAEPTPVTLGDTETMTSYSIDAKGVLSATFEDGTTKPLAQLAIANFVNPMGLDRVGETSFRATANSGPIDLNFAGEGSRGQLVGGALEMSNVDLAAEFTNLILAQRGFQASSRVITTSDQVLEDLVNIKR
jgi:flagellar hook protein FlgE